MTPSSTSGGPLRGLGSNFRESTLSDHHGAIVLEVGADGKTPDNFDLAASFELAFRWRWVHSQKSAGAAIAAALRVAERAQAAAVQVGSICPALSQYARRRSQHFNLQRHLDLFRPAPDFAGLARSMGWCAELCGSNTKGKWRSRTQYAFFRALQCLQGIRGHPTRKTPSARAWPPHGDLPASAASAHSY
jgi:hypothetical protein